MEEVLGGFAQMLRAAQKKYREFVRERKIDRSVMPDPKSDSGEGRNEKKEASEVAVILCRAIGVREVLASEPLFRL